MMFTKRQPNNQYIKSTEWSRANEPIWNTEIEDEYIHYPNMYELYHTFAKIFNVPIDNFILTSGCEESLKISLQVLKDFIKLNENGNLDYKTELVCESPTWGLAELIMNQYADRRNIFKKRKFVDYNSRINEQNDLIKQDVDYNISYSTSVFNGLFLHEGNIVLDNKMETYQDNKIIDCDLSNIKYQSFNIIDEVYHLSSLRNRSDPWMNHGSYCDIGKRPKDPIVSENYNYIFIGSFSKIFGAGFRLGYIYYNKRFDNLMKYYRPQYISRSAADLINILYDKHKKNKNIFYDFDESMAKCIHKSIKFRKKFKERPIYYSEHPNFISLDEYSLHHYSSLLGLDKYQIDKQFKLNNIDMVRLCRPLDFTLKDI